MACKCTAKTYEGHLAKVDAGYSGHVYTGHYHFTGFYWAPAELDD